MGICYRIGLQKQAYFCVCGIRWLNKAVSLKEAALRNRQMGNRFGYALLESEKNNEKENFLDSGCCASTVSLYSSLCEYHWHHRASGEFFHSGHHKSRYCAYHCAHDGTHHCTDYRAHSDYHSAKAEAGGH